MAAAIEARIGVVVPCHAETRHILGVLAQIPSCVARVFCVDDGCPEGTGRYVEENCPDPRVQVVYRPVCGGVGAATQSGFEAAIEAGCQVIVKMDGDGQMDPSMIPKLVEPILQGRADYTKGNRFFQIEHARGMPRTRLIGNAVLSFFSKLSTGYWRIFDPNNGFLAVHAEVLRLVPMDKVDNGFFFESDMLFRLNTLRATVIDVPHVARYADEVSKLSIPRVTPLFASYHFSNFLKRIFYNYFLRDFHLASLEWVLGFAFLLSGTVFGLLKWIEAASAGEAATAGQAVIAAMLIILGVQMLLAALSFDISNQPREPLHLALGPGSQTDKADSVGILRGV